MPKRCIFYVTSYPPHLPYLVCSLYTLRNWWSDDVKIFAWQESREIVERIAKEPSLCVTAVPHDAAYRGHCDQFADKITIPQLLTEYDSVLYLDADTTIHGDLSLLFDLAEQYGFCATQFNNWTMANGIPRSRVNTLREFPEIPVDAIDTVTNNHDWPSVNGGVWAARPNSLVLPIWHKWTMASVKTFICDEKVLHVLVPQFCESGQIWVLTGGAYNCSAMKKYQPADLPDEDVVVWHYHGDSNCRPDKSPDGCLRWRSIFEETVRRNIGGIRDWYRNVGNRFLNKWLQTNAELETQLAAAEKGSLADGPEKDSD